jgi:hypothetical protein
MVVILRDTEDLYDDELSQLVDAGVDTVVSKNTTANELKEVLINLF